METILVTGGSGLVGSAIKLVVSQSSDFTNYNFVFLSSKDCNLKDFNNTFYAFRKYNPTYVIHLAANVGGLFKNMNNKVQMFEDNMLMTMNVFK